MILLRRDLHFLFDDRRFTFVAKRSNDQDIQLVTHILLSVSRGGYELAELYHNRMLQALIGISVELLFARFAFSIFTDELYPSGAAMQYILFGFSIMKRINIQPKIYPQHR